MQGKARVGESISPPHSTVQKSRKWLMDFPLRNSPSSLRKRNKVTCLALHFLCGHCKSSAVLAKTSLSFFFLRKNSDKMEKDRSLARNAQMGLLLRPFGSWTNYWARLWIVRLITHKCEELVAIFHKAEDGERSGYFPNMEVELNSIFSQFFPFHQQPKMQVVIVIIASIWAVISTRREKLMPDYGG